MKLHAALHHPAFAHIALTHTALPAAALAVLASLAGCNDSGSSTDKPRPSSTSIVQPVANTAGTATPADAEDDRRITQEIRAALLRDESLSVSAQKTMVDTTNGHVTLRGVVESKEEKEAVERIAKSVKGVVSVANQLDVKKT